MAACRLYSHSIVPGELVLSEEESHHAVTVLRLRNGASVTLFDGRGGEAEGVVVRAARRALVVRADELRGREFELPRRLTLAVAMPKGHRQGVLIEKCTELGVAEILPIVTARSVVVPDRNAAVKWFRRAIEAAKQCECAWVPVIAAPVAFEESLRRISQFNAGAIAEPGSSEPFDNLLRSVGNGGSIVLWIGPAGGWTDAELESAGLAGAKRVRLSPTILRTETAAIAACALNAGGELP